MARNDIFVSLPAGTYTGICNIPVKPYLFWLVCLLPGLIRLISLKVLTLFSSCDSFLFLAGFMFLNFSKGCSFSFGLAAAGLFFTCNLPGDLDPFAVFFFPA
jgi:hypothetical protein